MASKVKDAVVWYQKKVRLFTLYYIHLLPWFVNVNINTNFMKMFQLLFDSLRFHTALEKRKT